MEPLVVHSLPCGESIVGVVRKELPEKVIPLRRPDA